MEFTKRKRRSADDPKRWVSDCGFFRISLFTHYGLRHYHAEVLVECTDGVHETRWEFAHRRGPYKTFKKAVEACLKNKRLWEAFIKLSHSPGRRDGKLIELKVRAPYVFMALPVWVRAQADETLINMLLPCPHALSDQDDPIATSKPSDNPSFQSSEASLTATIPASGPVSGAKAEDKPAGKKTTSSKVTNSPVGTPAKTAVEPAEQHVKPSKRSTTSKSPSGKPKSKRGKRKTGSGGVDSPSSRKKKGKR